MKKEMTTALVLMAVLAMSTPLFASGDAAKQTDSSMQKTGATQEIQSPTLSGQSGTAGATQETQSPTLSGQSGTAMDQPMTMQNNTAGAQIPTADELEGMKVVSQSGEEIGEISKVNADQQSGQIKFVTLSKGGILGMGGDEIAVPLEAISFDNDRATLNVDQSKLDNAPQQAGLSDEQFQRDLQSHYGVSSGWQQGSPGQDAGASSTMQPMGESMMQDKPASQDAEKPKTY